MTENINHLQQIRNFYAYSDELASGGQPVAEQFTLIRDAGYTRIINLACEDSPGAVPGEGALVRKLGMDYLHIPVDFKAPGQKDLENFFQAMQADPSARTFVHCAYNWRVSCFIYLYRTMLCGINEESAIQDLYNIWQPDPVWEEFIHNVQLLRVSDS